MLIEIKQIDLNLNLGNEKTDLADEIYVINVEGYIGSSTKSEIEYALAHDKKVNYLEKPIK